MGTSMAVEITGTEPGSKAANLGVQKGDRLLSINGHEINDVLDYRFYETERELTLCLSRGEEVFSLSLRKPQYASLGLCFDTYLMDAQRSCRNNCIFCFIDQLPPGMRDTLYFKDDDDRLSFLFGNYITLTNIDEQEIDRIISMHISPINVSVHTMDPELRCKMMHNRFAGEALRHLYRLAEHGVALNCQLVLCPGINDGAALDFSLEQLFQLGDSLQSVACVPVGITRYREGLAPLVPYTEETAGETLDRITAWGDRFIRRSGTRIVYASDEFYLLAKRPLPPVEFYEDFPQIENGVGMLRNLEDELAYAMEDYVEAGGCLPQSPRKVTVPTGEGAYGFIKAMLEQQFASCPALTIQLVPVANDFFGGSVDVTGLLTGGDVGRALEKMDLGDEVLLPANMLRAGEDVFLDDVSVAQLSQRLGVPVTRMENTGDAVLCALLGLPAPQARGHNLYEQ